MISRLGKPLLYLLAAVLACAPANAEPEEVRPISASAALALDANQYAVRFAVSPEEALWRLRAQQASLATTEAIRKRFGSRLAGISIQHQPGFEIRVLLTGNAPVPPEMIPSRVRVDGWPVPIAFVTGAPASRTDVVRAMVQYQSTLRTELPNARGMGHDQKTGEMVLLVTRADSQLHGLDAIREQARSITGVPVRVEVVERQTNLGATGGGRVDGVDPNDGKRYACTTAFVVTNGERDGITTAAHCPNDLAFREPDGSRLSLSFDGQWGWRYRDVQLHVSAERLEPLFFSDRRSGTVRQAKGWRNRTSLRAGEWLCHYGESSGYSCEVIELTDYAPPGELCGGPCALTWVTVSGPICKSGDSGGPVFLGSTAIGITKGGSSRSGGCNFYYFMSTDFLPDGWRVLTSGPINPPQGQRQSRKRRGIAAGR